MQPISEQFVDQIARQVTANFSAQGLCLDWAELDEDEHEEGRQVVRVVLSRFFALLQPDLDKAISAYVDPYDDDEEESDETADRPANSDDDIRPDDDGVLLLLTKEE